MVGAHLVVFTDYVRVLSQQLKLPGFHGNSRFGVFEKKTRTNNKKHHGNKAQEPEPFG